MEKNTVVIPLEDYNELRDFKTKVLKGDGYYVSDTYHMCGQYPGQFYSQVEIAKFLVDENKQLKGEDSKLRKRISDLKTEFSDVESKLKKMSLWEFFKWKRR